MDLFEYSHRSQSATPGQKPTGSLSETIRPKQLSELHLPKALAQRLKKFCDICSIQAANRRPLPSLLVFGPPGVGKTSLMRSLIQELKLDALYFLPTEEGAKGLKTLVERSRQSWLMTGVAKTLFVDEVHRLNRATQDILLSALEEGSLQLLGSTTENPSHALNPALLSRVQVFQFEPVRDDELKSILIRALAQYDLKSIPDVFTDGALEKFLAYAGGDARRLLNACEILFSQPELQSKLPLTPQDLDLTLGELVARFQSKGSEHYDLASALIKSIRGSDPDAGLYYLARLYLAKENVEFIARRLVILASEDIGNADPRALQLATSALEAVRSVGWPEARIIFAQTVIYLACAPKSNSAYLAIDAAIAVAEQTLAAEVPHALRSSKTALSRSLGYGTGYKYAHNSERGYIEQRFLPDNVSGPFVRLKDVGFEKQLAQNLAYMRREPKKSDETQG